MPNRVINNYILTLEDNSIVIENKSTMQRFLASSESQFIKNIFVEVLEGFYKVSVCKEHIEISATDNPLVISCPIVSIGEFSLI